MSGNDISSVVDNLRIGVVGGGHLGQAILESLIHHGFIKKNIYVSYNGNPATFNKLERMGLSECISQNDKIFNKAEIIFLTVKPQDVKCLQKLSISANVVIVSCLAGASINILKNIFNATVFRMMLSGPDTIGSERGIAALYPYNELVSCILSKMKVQLFQVLKERDIDIFTTGVCLPAALLLERNELAIELAIHEIGKEYPAFFDIYNWAKSALPSLNTENERSEYISKMITKGGITETIIDSLKSGESFITALRKGISRSQDISLKISSSI